MSGLVLGVDGGASKTVALLATLDGRVVGAGRAGNADIYRGPAAEREVGRAVADALATGGAVATDLAGAALSLVGADWPEDFDHWRGALPGIGLAALAAPRVRIVNDAIGALHCCSGRGPAVAIVCGTGGATGARGASGACWHSSFWQRTQGAVELARRALDAIYRAELGIAPATTLTRRALGHFGTADVERLLHAFTARHRPKPLPVAGFAPRILDAASEGDAVARALVLSHADALAEHGLAAARQVGIDAATVLEVVLAGGLFRHGCGLMTDRVWARLHDVHAAARRVANAPEPVVGALMMALEAAGATPGETHRASLRASLPPAALFRTDAVGERG